MSNESESGNLVSRIIGGDSSAEDELVRRYKAGIGVIINRIVRNFAITEDLLQETFIIVLEKIRRGDVRDAQKISGFISSVARNHAIEYIRKARQSANYEEITEAEHIPDPSPSPLEVLTRRERDACIRQVIDELKVERDRQVLIRFYILEEAKDQICVALALTSVQFDNIIYRAKARYKELYIKRLGDN